jgi:23S rRNA (cytidine1920-2'-O)/16S rRNA (cytidine1409-2'-O)-methyltransferase
MRLDIYIKEKVNSRNKAQTLINEGKVLVNSKICTKPAYEVTENDLIEITETEKYVGRGGYKLEKAIEHYNISLNDKICLDVGASTGGFTQCMLQNNAKKVYAVDVGKSQLADVLKNDSKVISLEQTDIRNFSPPEKIDFCAIDVSFISLTKILPFVNEMDINEIIVLIKPQFEVGKGNIGKKGIVKDKKIRQIALENIIDFSENLCYNVREYIHSPIIGGSGNIEYLMYMVKYED